MGYMIIKLGGGGGGGWYERPQKSLHQSKDAKMQNNSSSESIGSLGLQLMLLLDHTV